MQSADGSGQHSVLFFRNGTEMLKTKHCIAAAMLAALVLSTTTVTAEDPTKLVLEQIAKMRVGKHDWPQWGGSASRNNTPEGRAYNRRVDIVILKEKFIEESKDARITRPLPDEEWR